MGIAIAILLCLAACGSLLWMVPSQREKQLTSLRRLAMKHGLRVRLLDAGLMKNCFPWLRDHRGLALYELPKSLASSSRDSFPAWAIRLPLQPLSEFEEAANIRRQELIREHLERLPVSAEALLFHPAGVVLLWREQIGGRGVQQEAEIEPVITRLAEGLQELAEVLVKNKLLPVA